MFESLSKRLNQVFDQLKRRGTLSTEDVDAAMREIRLALLEADVHYGVVKDFVGKVRERGVGHAVSKALVPGQQVLKIVHEELIAALGEPVPLNLVGGKPRGVMLVGLQGSGKTTTAGKLASLLRSRGERVLLVAGDPYRPAAAKQLQALGESLNIPVYSLENSKNPVDIANEALEIARKGGYTVILIDTAGRSQLDDDLMQELQDIAKAVGPVETLLVVDAMLGQEAVQIARGFRESLNVTGLVLTKMDGDARGGAAISIRSVTGIPIKYLGTGEKLDALEVYYPDRLASRILGMGDMLGLIERAEAAFDENQTRQSAEKMAKGEFSLEDLVDIMQSSKKMGPMSQMLEMLPGSIGAAARDISPDEIERQFNRTEAIIRSMTPSERRNPEILNASRRRRIAKGSGTEVQELNRLVKQFREMQRLMKTLQKNSGRGLARLFG
ncbi:MAG: signal recognition particle protein [Chloroflexota bacterium]